VALVGAGALRDGAVVVHSPNVDHLRAALLCSTGIAGIVYDTLAFAGSLREVLDVASVARFGIGTSENAVRILRGAGLPDAVEIPFVFGTRCWDVPSDVDTARLLADGKANCLYAGPLSFHAGVDRLVAAFAFLLALDVDARLVLCGPLDPADVTQSELRRLVVENGLAERVLFIDSADTRRVVAAYRAASIFWTLGSISNALAPVVDALWFDLPILAHASAPSAALLGPAGLLLRDEADAVRIAGLAKILISDGALRAKMLAVQSRRREELTCDRGAGAALAREVLLGIRSLETSSS
jgi:glycosyltransferase involved in cell wall biosynthesis